MTLLNKITKKLKYCIKAVKYHLFETDHVFIYWPDFNKGILLIIFALIIIPGHLLWYLVNYHSENNIWFSTDYYAYRMFTTACQMLLTLALLFIALKFQHYRNFRKFMGWFIPLYFGLLLIYSAHTVGIYSPAAMGGILNILLIGFVFYQPKVIYSIMVIVSIVFIFLGYFTHAGVLAYAPLFSDRLNDSDLFSNTFWLKSMAILYLPILVVSAGFFEILLRQWRRREQKIDRLSKVDSLTNVYNRRYTTDYVQQLVEKGKFAYAMVILDLDYFKRINDHYGHNAGDEVLRQVAKVLCSNTRQQDIAGRLGGEEFVLILPSLSLQEALDVAERCRQEIQQLNIVLNEGQTLNVSASFGVAVADDLMTMDDVSRLADQALYLSKQKGRNAVSHYLELNTKTDMLDQDKMDSV